MSGSDCGVLGYLGAENSGFSTNLNSSCCVHVNKVNYYYTCTCTYAQVNLDVLVCR